MPAKVAPMLLAPPAEILVILLLALGLDALAGDMRPLFARVPHPVAAFGRLAGLLERRLNRPQRSAADRRMRGVLLVAFAVAASGVLGGLAMVATRLAVWGWPIEVLVVAVLLAQRSLYDHVRDVALALESRNLPAARAAVSHIVGRDPQSLDEHGVSRAAIESLFENFSDGVIAPALWYAAAGLPGLLACKAVNTLDSMIGHREERYADFGWAAARTDTVANFLPARLSGAIISLAALFVPGASPARARRTMLADAAKHRSTNAGWPEAAAAGALGLALAGPRRYGGVVVHDAWMGDGRARATAVDIRRALLLYVAACLVHAALLAAFAVAIVPR